MSSSPLAKSCSTRWPASCSAASSTIALAGVSRPTALPIRACLVGKEESTIAVRCSLRSSVRSLRVVDGEPREAAAALEVGRVVQRLERRVGDRLLEGDRDADDAAVELGDRDLHRGVERGEAGVRLGPALPRRGRAQRLDDGDVERFERLRVPLVARVRAAGREHGRDQRVDLAVEQLQRGRVAAEASRPRRATAWPPASSMAVASASMNAVLPVAKWER